MIVSNEIFTCRSKKILQRNLYLNDIITESGYTINPTVTSTLQDHHKRDYNSNKHQTGMAPFMARALLSIVPEGVNFQHQFSYDLESWLYIFLHVTLGYTPESPRGHPLRRWWKRDWNDVLNAKHAFFTSVWSEFGYLTILDSVSGCLIKWQFYKASHDSTRS